jgi:hypothetical protein
MAPAMANAEQGGGCRATFFNYRRRLGGNRNSQCSRIDVISRCG